MIVEDLISFRMINRGVASRGKGSWDAHGRDPLLSAFLSKEPTTGGDMTIC